MAHIEEGPNGEMILVDPEGYGVMMAVAKHNCSLTLEANADRVAHFRNRAIELGRTSDDVVIVIANVDDTHGNILADALMPGFDWQSIRDQGQVPFARGLAGRDGVQGFLKLVDGQADQKLSQFKSNELAVVVVDHGTCEVF